MQRVAHRHQLTVSRRPHSSPVSAVPVHDVSANSAVWRSGPACLSLASKRRGERWRRRSYPSRPSGARCSLCRVPPTPALLVKLSSTAARSKSRHIFDPRPLEASSGPVRTRCALSPSCPAPKTTNPEPVRVHVGSASTTDHPSRSSQREQWDAHLHPSTDLPPNGRMASGVLAGSWAND